MSRIADAAERAMQAEAGQAEIFDLKVNYIGVDDGAEELSSTSRIVHAGRRTVVADCRVETTGGRLVATATATFAVTREKKE